MATLLLVFAFYVKVRDVLAPACFSAFSKGFGFGGGGSGNMFSVTAVRRLMLREEMVIAIKSSSLSPI